MKSEKTEIQRVLWCIHLVCKIDVIKHDLMELDDSQKKNAASFTLHTCISTQNYGDQVVRHLMYNQSR